MFTLWIVFVEEFHRAEITKDFVRRRIGPNSILIGDLLLVDEGNFALVFGVLRFTCWTFARGGKLSKKNKHFSLVKVYARGKFIASGSMGESALANQCELDTSSLQRTTSTIEQRSPVFWPCLLFAPFNEFSANAHREMSLEFALLIIFFHKRSSPSLGRVRGDSSPLTPFIRFIISKAAPSFGRWLWQLQRGNDVLSYSNSTTRVHRVH